MIKDFDITKEQFEQLTAVFRAEGREHVKTLADALLSLEQGAANDAPAAVQAASREAHSLKGSAGTLGFERVAVLTHRLEDVLGAIRRTELAPSPEILDTLLHALDAIRSCVDSSAPGDETFLPGEMETMAALDKALSAGRPAASAPARGPEAPPVARSKTPLPAEAEQISSVPAERGGVIRISEDSLDSVITKVDEIVDERLQLEALSEELKRAGAQAGDLAALIAALEALLRETRNGEQASIAAEKAESLHLQVKSLTKTFESHMRQTAKLVHGAEEDLRKIRLAPVSSVFPIIRRQVRDLGRLTSKHVDLTLAGGEYAVDRKVLEAIEDPLIHILRNAVDHGIEGAGERAEAGKKETGLVSVAARHVGDAVELSISDDGRGISLSDVRRSLVEKRGLAQSDVDEMGESQLFDFLFESGFSTQSDVSVLSGRGFGLDVVKITVERLGGEVRVDSRPGAGTTITLRLPLVLSTARCLLVRAHGRIAAIPASNVDRVVLVKVVEVRRVGGADVMTYEGQNVPIRLLAEMLGVGGAARARPEADYVVTLVRFGERRAGLVVDEIVEYAHVVIKPLGDLLERVPNVSGVSLLGSGEMALVLNPPDLVHAASATRKGQGRVSVGQSSAAAAPVPTILVVDDSIATRALEKALLESVGYNVIVAADGLKALDVLGSRRCDLVLSDIKMPNMDGLELTRTIKSRPALSGLPVILVTAQEAEGEKAAGLAAGADAYIIKRNLTQREFIDTINQLL
ncbi:MAG: response regulator [Deltaproteobacteria bacterium]|nr:response regulator [Deltaproteobacteria bacterium]